MSLWERSDWKGGFPFTPTRIRPQGRGIKGQGGEINVTAAQIPDAVPRALALPPRTLTQDGAIVQKAVPDALAVRVAPASRRLAPRHASLRLMPLGAFSWGGDGIRSLPRTRPDHVLLWVTDGQMRLDFPRQAKKLCAEDIRFIPAGTAFATRPDPRAEGHVLLIAPELVADVDPPLPTGMMAGRAGQAGPALLGNLHELVAEAQQSPDRKALNLHLNLLSLRLSRLAPGQERDATQPSGPEGKSLVECFQALAALEMGSVRTLAELAQDLGATLTQLDRACLAAQGRRAVDLMNEWRLERATELLRHTDQPCARIAQDLGYASQTHFTRAFVTTTGRTPETYRQQMR